MTDTMTPTYLTVDAAGNVGASFTGDVHGRGFWLDTAETPPPALYPPAETHELQWRRPADAEVGGRLYTIQDDVASAIDLVLAAMPLAGAPAMPNSGVYALADAETVLLVSNSGLSSFLRTQGITDWVLRMGTTAVAVGAASDADYNIAIGIGWPNAHLFFAAFGWPRTHWNFTPKGAIVVDASNGAIHLTNPGVAQTIDVFWLSIGD